MNYKKFESSTYRKLINNYKLGTLLVQLTYLAFPLSMYIVYNKIISAKNPNAILILVLFLLVVLGIQLCLKVITSIQKSIIDTNLQIKNHQKIISKNIEIDSSLFTQTEHDTINEIYNIPKNNEQKIQTEVANAYYIFVIMYIILITMIGGFIIIVPLITFTLNYILVKRIGEKYKHCNEQYINALDAKNAFIKEMLLKMKAIKGLNISGKIAKKYDELSLRFNKYKYEYMYLSNLSTRITAGLNIITMSFMVIFGRYLFSINYLTIEEVVTCSILTVWVSRSLVQLFNNIANNNLASQHEFDDYVQTSAQDLSQITSLDQQDYQNIKQKLTTDAAITISKPIDLKKIYKLLLAERLQVSYVNLDFKIFYGSVMHNLTLFDDTRENDAISIASELGVDQLIATLPYKYNYVLSNQYDEALTIDLGLFISIIRELLIEPDYLIIDCNISNVNQVILKNLINYCRKKNIKLISKKIIFDLSDKYNVGPADNSSTNKKHQENHESDVSLNNLTPPSDEEHNNG